MKFLRRIPLLGFILVAYDVLVLVKDESVLTKPLFTATLMSKAVWTPTVGDLVVVFGLIFLFFEIYKSTRTGEAAIVGHILSTLIFVVFLIEFIVFKKAGTTPFFLLVLMSLFDVVAGFSITIKTARRDFAMDRDSNIVSPAGS